MTSMKAVLFDFDGVLGKTMEDNARAWHYALSQYNIRFDKDEYFLFEGLNTRKVVEHFSAPTITAATMVDEIVALKEAYYLRNNNFSLYDGAETLISDLKKSGYQLGLVTAANHIRISKTVSQKLLGCLNVIISGDAVNNCKPHPEPYLRAAEALSILPLRCVVIENAPLGIEAAKAAGMYCIAIASTLERHCLQKADMVVDTLMDLRSLL